MENSATGIPIGNWIGADCGSSSGVVTGNTTATNYHWEAIRPLTPYGLSISCTPEVKEYNPIKPKGGKKMKSTKLKVGDKVKMDGTTGEYTVIKLQNERQVVFSSGVDGALAYRAEKSENGLWFCGASAIVKVGNAIKKVPSLLVKGHTPRLVIKVGCKEFDVKGINKLVKRLLSMAKASKQVVGGQAVFSGEGFYVEDIENAIKWLKENKITS